MAVKILQIAQEREYDLTGIRVDLSRKTGVLIRQSRRKSDKDHYEGRLRQETMVPVAVEIRGDEDDHNVELYDEGAGISGTKGYDERPKISKLYIDIANDIVGSLVMARADRLFRDKHFRNVSMFTELAEKKRVKLIVPGKAVYDFTRTKDLQAFQKEMQDAYNYLATQILYLNETRQQKIMRGLYGGGHLPAPYVIERAAWKDEQRPVIYQPWQDIAIELLTEFRDSDFSLAYIVRYIESRPCLFPYPSAEDLRKYDFHTIMTKMPKGYTITSIDALKHYLSNLTLGGYAKVGRDELGNEILLANAWDAAVPIDLLAPCYGAITGHYPDGTPFERWKDSRRSRKHTGEWESDAILHGFLKSDDGPVSFSIDNQEHKNTRSRYTCNAGSEIYGKNRLGILQTKTRWGVSCKELDTIVLVRLNDLVEYDTDIADRLKEMWEARKATGIVDEATVLQTQIAKAEAHIKNLDDLLTNPPRPLSKETKIRYIGQLEEAENALENLLAKQNTQSGKEDPERVIPNFYYVLKHLPTEFPKLDSEHQKKMIRRVIKEIKLNIVSPHLFLLHIEWEDGIAARKDVALIWRGALPNISEAWNVEEDEALEVLYPEASQTDVMRALPRFPWSRICNRAAERGICRTIASKGRERINRYHRTMTWQDLEAAASLVKEPRKQEQMREIAETLAENTRRGKLSEHWWLPPNEISYLIYFDENDFDEMDFSNGESIPDGSPHPAL